MPDAMLPPPPAHLRRFLGLLEEVNQILAQASGPMPGPPMPDCAMYLVSPEGTIRSWSDGSALLYGFREEEVLGRPLSILEGKGGTGRRFRKGGQAFWVHLREAVLRDDQGRSLGICRVETEIPAERRSA